MAFDTNQTDNDALMSQYIRSRYFSPHSFKQFTNNLTQDQIESSLSIFHNNIRSLNRNLENLVTHYLQELGIHFNVIGVTETKITNSYENTGLSNIPGYMSNWFAFHSSHRLSIYFAKHASFLPVFAVKKSSFWGAEIIFSGILHRCHFWT